MSLHGNANKVRPSPWLAKTFITLVVVGGIAVLGHDVLQLHFLNFYEFLSLLTMALVASRLKLKLPGLNGNMSVNLPFILIASTLLSRGEALSIAAASTLVQCLPKKGKKLVPAQVLFNVSTMAIAAILGTLVYTAGSHFGVGLLFRSLPLVIAAAMFFLGNTVLVATVISLTEGEKIFRVWSNVFQLSFPYYVASAGITSMVTTASRHLGWQIPLLVLPVMYGIYRSYQLYFGRTVATVRGLAFVAADRHSSQKDLHSLENVDV
jgi:hypothetical protein